MLERQVVQNTVQRRLFPQPVVLKLDVQRVWLEALTQLAKEKASLVLAFIEDALAQRPAHAARQADEPLRSALETLQEVVRAASGTSRWIYVLLVRECAGDVRREPEEVFVSLCGRSQERKVAKLAAEDGLDLRFVSGFVEAKHAEHCVVIGQRDRAVRALDQIFHPDRAIEERVLGVDVEVNELSQRDPRT